MFSFFLGMVLGGLAIAITLYVREESAMGALLAKSLLLPLSALLFLDAFGVTGGPFHWAVITVMIVIAVIAAVTNLILWLVTFAIWQAK